MFRMKTLQNRVCKELLSYGLAMKVFFDAIMWWYNAQLYWGGLMAAAPRNCPALDAWWKVWFFSFFFSVCFAVMRDSAVSLLVLCSFNVFHVCFLLLRRRLSFSLSSAVLFWVGPGVVIRLSIHCCLRQMLWSNVEREGSWTWLQCA